MKVIFLFLALFISATTVIGQTSHSIKGRVLDSQKKSGLPGATVLFVSKADTIHKLGTITNEHGDFNMKLKPGKYDCHISFIGYKDINRSISVGKSAVDLGLLKLIENTELLNELTVVETLPPTKQRGDTTLFNPRAFKVNPDATAGELLAKMPGFYENNGKLMVEGQEIAEILVDGKKFFGNNKNKTLSIIPNDVIKNIEVYEYKSDDEKFTGFKDDQQKKTLNIVTKKKKKTLLFGDLAAGVGKKKKYGINGNMNIFSENGGITITGKSISVNAPLKLGNRRFGGGSISGNDVKDNGTGINITHSKNNNDLEFSYQYGDSENENKNSSIKYYTSQALEGQIASNSSQSNNNSDSHNMNLRVSLNSNPKNRIQLSTNFSSSESNTSSLSLSDTQLNDRMINENSNKTTSENKNYNINQAVHFSRRLGKKGRVVSLFSTFSHGRGNSDGTQLSETLNESRDVSQRIDRISNGENKNSSIGAGLSYSEPLNEKTYLSVGYNVHYNKQESDKSGYNFDENTKTYSHLDELTTNRFDNSTINNLGRFSINMRGEKSGVSFGSDLQFTTLKSEESFPNKIDFKKDFFALKPFVRYSYRLDDQKRISLNYNMQTSNPSVTNLQEVMDLTNPLYISTGNSGLKQSHTHSLMAFYMASNIEKGRYISINTHASTSYNMVCNRTLVAAKDTTINNSVFLPAGGQFSQPVNLDGQYTVSANVSYSMPVKKLKSKLNINSRAGFSHNPTFINDKKSFTDSWNLNQGFMLSSNINEKIDFTLSSSSNYTNSKNSSGSSSRYISQTTSLNMYWNFFKDFVIRTNASNNYQNNYSTGKENTFWHMNLGLSTRMFKSKRGEISLTAYDLLSKEDDRSHMVTDMYTMDSFRNKLTNFYMLTFSYKLRNAKKGSYDRLH